VFVVHLVGVDPQDVHVGFGLEAGVFQRLVDGHVGVLQPVLPDQRDVDFVGRVGGDDFPPAVVAVGLRNRLLS
jgi:hypothetical protein